VAHVDLICQHLTSYMSPVMDTFFMWSPNFYFCVDKTFYCILSMQSKFVLFFITSDNLFYLFYFPLTITCRRLTHGNIQNNKNMATFVYRKYLSCVKTTYSQARDFTRHCSASGSLVTRVQYYRILIWVF